jgi:BlaI family penicillinase repressor
MEPKLFDAEYRFISIVWDNEPISSGELAKICANQLQWKRTTTYTVLKKLINRGLMENHDSIVKTLVKREQVQHFESIQVVDKMFDKSLPKFITAFMGEKKLSSKEVDELKHLIDLYHEEK